MTRWGLVVVYYADLGFFLNHEKYINDRRCCMGVKIVDTALRDGSQSLIATRLTTDEILQVAPLLDKAGFELIYMSSGFDGQEICDNTERYYFIAKPKR